MDDCVYLGVSPGAFDVDEAEEGHSFPVYSVFLPIYSFWSMDDFSWGNTR